MKTKIKSCQNFYFFRQLVPFLLITSSGNALKVVEVKCFIKNEI